MHFIKILLMLSWVSDPYASEYCGIKNGKSFYSYLKTKGPMLDEVNKRKEQFKPEITIAQQRPNPEISFDYLKSDQFGLTSNSFNLTAQHIIEFGSKRDRRVAKAEVLNELNNTQIDLGMYSSTSSAVLVYQKTAQHEILIKAVQEASDTFSKIVKKLSGRKQLNPEETVSLSTLRLASNEYLARLNDLENQRSLLEGQVKFFSDCNNPGISYTELNFPMIAKPLDSKNDSGLVRLEDVKVNLANKELDLQKSLAYSNILVGPTVEFQNQGADQFVSGGVALSFSLPLFHANDGGKNKAVKEFEFQKIQTKNNKRNLHIERENLLKKYQRSILTFKKMPSLKDLDRKHQEVEQLFSRGVVSIAMTIESHRQQVDFLKSRFEIENDLLETYTKINLIDGELSSLDDLF